MDRDWIDNVKIEHRGANGDMNITVFVHPPRVTDEQPRYPELVKLATTLFHATIDPDINRFQPANAEVMAWSDEGYRGMLTPHRYRVTVDFELQIPESGDQELG